MTTGTDNEGKTDLPAQDTQPPDPDDPAVVDEAEPPAEPSLDTAEPASPKKPARADRGAAARTKAGRPPGRLRRLVGTDPVRMTALACVTAAAVAAAWFGWGWHTASGDDSLAHAKLRDQVLQTGEQAVLNLNTLDYRNVEGGLKTWQDSSTAELYNQIVQGRAQLEKELAKAKTASSAKILESALLELDAHTGKAGIIVAIQVTVVAPDGKPSVRNSRLLGQLTKTSSGWKLSALGQAPTGN